jgi:Protein of unknown function (DUF5818)
VKKTRASYHFWAALVAALLLPWSAAAAGTRGQIGLAQNPSSQPVAQEKSQRSDQNDVKTFTGTISKSNGNYVLEESTAGGTYGLDDQKTASNYEGKKVVVTGTYDSDSKTIHVQKIEELA